MSVKRVFPAIALIVVTVVVTPVSAQFAAPGELQVMRADYFRNYAGSFLSIEVFDDQVSGDGGNGPSVSVAWRTASGSYGPAVDVPRYIDPVPTPAVYLYNRTLVRVGPAAGPSDTPASVRITSSTGAQVEAAVRPWVAGNLLPHVAGYKTDFFTHYEDPTEVRADLDALGAQYPELISVLNLPEKSSGYQRKATTVMGTPSAFGNVAYAGQTGNLSAADAQRAVIIESLAFGHDGGNNIFVTFTNPGAANQPLSVSSAGNEVIVHLASDASGAISSTAGQVSDALNATPGVSGMLRAYRYRNAAGTGIVAATPRSHLSDWLNAPASVARGPFQGHVYRIGSHRDGSKVGVFIYCQQSASDWVTPLTCQEAAHQLTENYATDPATKQLLDNVEIFVIPTVNPDGAHYSMYDNAPQRKTLANKCPNTFQDPMARNSVGVDLDRNGSVGSIFDGYIGASATCTDAHFAGPFELSEPESRNIHWVVNTFPNIRFSLNVQSDGGYLMWSPGSYQVPGRVTLPRMDRGVDDYFSAVGESILTGVKRYRNTVVLPERVGTTTDVRGPEAGNSADNLWYLNGVFAYTLALGADRFDSLTAGTDRTPVGVRPALAPEGHDEALEFAGGIFELVHAAYNYALDITAPSVDLVPNGGASATSIAATFGNFSEPATIYYTLDGSTPTVASPTWNADRPRMAGPSFLFTQSTTVKWIAVDVKGNTSAVRFADFLIDATPPVTTATISPAGVNGWNVSPTIALTASDGQGSGVDFIEYRIDGGAWTTYSAPFVVTGDGSHTLDYHAVDLGANAEAVQTLALKVDATAPATTSVISPVAVNGWYVNPTVVLNASDGSGIGVNAIEYRIDGGALTTYAGAFAIAGDGVHSLEYRASDLLGNVAAFASRSVQVDGTNPEISVAAPAAGAAYNVGAIVPAAYLCSDAGSGVSICSGTVAVGASVDTATVGPHAFVVDARDVAGNTRQVTVTYTVINPNVPGNIRGNGSVAGANAQEDVDFDLSVSEVIGSESGDVQIKIKRKHAPDDQFDSTTAGNVIFSDAPAYTPGGSVAIDTVTFSGSGRWNGQNGYQYIVTASDRGEPGKNLDTFTIVISAPNGSVVLSSGGTLTKGNLQSQ